MYSLPLLISFLFTQTYLLHQYKIESITFFWVGSFCDSESSVVKGVFDIGRLFIIISLFLHHERNHLIPESAELEGL